MEDFFIETGLRYWKGELHTAPIARPFRASRREDVADAVQWPVDQTTRYAETAARSVLAGEGVFSMLVAGASSRMNVLEAPEDVRRLMPAHGVLSKAAVPAGLDAEGKPSTYLEEFGLNVSRFLSRMESLARRRGLPCQTAKNEILLLSNGDYRAEHDEILKRNAFFGLDRRRIRFMHQPLGPKFVATPADVEKLRSSLEPERFQEALAISQDVKRRLEQDDPQAVILEGESDPLGHGEYFHELVSSGELLRLIESGKKWVFLKNVDNLAAKIDPLWLALLGRFLTEGVDMQPELSPRAPGRKGGSLIIRTDDNTPELAEDPNIEASNALRASQGLEPVMPTTGSYWFNDAVTLFTPRFVASLYKEDGQSEREFIDELSRATSAQRAALADRGRKRFPAILDAKPAKKSKAVAVKCETNLWQSTALADSTVKVSPVGVLGAMNLDLARYQTLDEAGRFAELQKLRFLSTKNWDKSPAEKQAAREGMERILGREVSDLELGLSLETYEGNKLLVSDLLAYNRKAELIPPDLFSS